MFIYILYIFQRCRRCIESVDKEQQKLFKSNSSYNNLDKWMNKIFVKQTISEESFKKY